MLGVPVDPEQRRVATEPADDQVALRRRHPEVLVGQAAGQLDHGARKALQDRDPVQQGLQLVVRGGHRTQSSNALRTVSSIVCLGPVNHFFAETCHQIASTIRTPKVSIGA